MCFAWQAQLRWVYIEAVHGVVLFRYLTKMEGEMARLDRPALADFLRTVPSRAPRAVNGDSFKPAASAKLYAEVGC